MPKHALPMIVRHATLADLDALFELMAVVEVGMTSLPKDKAVLKRRLEQTTDTLQGKLDKAAGRYLFVLENSQTGQIVGISAIEVAVGKKEPFYDFRIMTQVHSSKELDVYNSLDVLVMSNDYTGASELCSLFVMPAYRSADNGKLISKARMMFMAAHPQCFAQTVMAEMRGYFDDEGVSPFWTHFSAKFFKVDFAKVDYLIGTANKGFIAELMPRFPIYLDFVADEAKEAIGKVHPNTASALNLLEGEGLRFKNHIDIIDGGPKVEAAVKDLRAVEDSQVLTVVIDDDNRGDSNGDDDTLDKLAYLVANDDYINFRTTVVYLPYSAFEQNSQSNSDSITLPKSIAQALHVKSGDKVRILPLNPPKAKMAKRAVNS